MAAYCPGTLGFELVTTQETVAAMFRVEHTRLRCAMFGFSAIGWGFFKKLCPPI